MIYLADLFHTYQRGKNADVPYTVPLGIGYVGAVARRYRQVRLFRDPDRLLAALRERAPDYLGLSLSSWNLDLSRQVAGIARGMGVKVVGGGPAAHDFDWLDHVVFGEGEAAFLELIQSDNPKRVMHGGRPAVVDDAGMEVLSPKQVRSPEGIVVPSPYLDGSLDEFLEEGLTPIVQTMRGCPYQCSFCVSGATERNRMRGFGLERVKAEISYVRKYRSDLILTDENWGILGERDVEIARHIMANPPKRLYYYTAKIVTEASRQIVEMVNPVAWIAGFSMSFQSLNPQSRDAVKRTNIPIDKLKANLQWAHDRGIGAASEMIYGFPYETPDTFFDGVERLVGEGVDTVLIFPLQLFPGIPLYSAKDREDYGISTMFRLADTAYGIYDDGRLISAEAEEIVVGTRWSSMQDYFAVRLYGLFQQLMLGRGKLWSKEWGPKERIVRLLSTYDYSGLPEMNRIVNAYLDDAKAELKATREEVSIRDGDIKLNLVYIDAIKRSKDALNELSSLIAPH